MIMFSILCLSDIPMSLPMHSWMSITSLMIPSLKGYVGNDKISERSRWFNGKTIGIGQMRLGTSTLFEWAKLLKSPQRIDLHAAVMVSLVSLDGKKSPRERVFSFR